MSKVAVVYWSGTGNTALMAADIPIHIMGKHIILMVCTDMYILFSNVMQRESR